jgi:hypothetical protein
MRHYLGPKWKSYSVQDTVTEHIFSNPLLNGQFPLNEDLNCVERCELYKCPPQLPQSPSFVASWIISFC